MGETEIPSPQRSGSRATYCDQGESLRELYEPEPAYCSSARTYSFNENSSSDSNTLTCAGKCILRVS
jgi:hypothetical protein